MTALKSARTLAASLGVLAGVALAATPAMAFDKVDWNWTVHKYQKEYVDVDVDIDIDATGLVQIEKLQIFLGDSKAYANVYGVFNEPDRAYVKVPTRVEVCKTSYFGKKECGWEDSYKYEPLALTVAQLPEVTNAASAFGNLQVITADVPIFLHDGQFVANAGDGEGWNEGIDPQTAIFGLGLALAGVGGNTHTDLAKVFTWGAVTGVLDKADIKAEANVAFIKNATVDNSAFAAANLIQVSLESDLNGGPVKTTCAFGNYHGCTTVTPPSNHLVQADITQFAYADVTAKANVGGVYVSGYDLNGLDRSIVNNVATAIGNAVIVNVGNVPVPETPTN